MERLERLINLLSALIDTSHSLSREEIRRRVPGYSDDEVAFRRAFERDKETLRSMGVALITEPLDADFPDHGEGYRIPREKYALPDPALTREETDALVLAASIVKLRSDAANSALTKLGAESNVRTVNEVAVDLSDDERLSKLFAARSEYRTITFRYRDKNRHLDPYRLSFRNGRWYVNGFDRDYQDLRTYRVDRIDGDVSIDDVQSFAPPKPASQPWLAPWQMGDETPIPAQVWIDADQAAFAVEQAGDACVKQRNDDGSVVLELQVTNRDAFRSYVLGFLTHAEIMGPHELRNDMRAYLQSLIA
jgi:proteasome accessory factor B